MFESSIPLSAQNHIFVADSLNTKLIVMTKKVEHFKAFVLMVMNLKPNIYCNLSPMC